MVMLKADGNNERQWSQLRKLANVYKVLDGSIQGVKITVAKSLLLEFVWG